ncbi:MAG: SMI1/KNR4 family protein [Candidatus Bathyarchaeota archaeon]|nr:SMI1/KNR4 family protein [Candidatus Termitimicrobium sp.]
MSKNLEWWFSYEPVSDEDIVAIEFVLNVKFPSDYVECAKKNHGGSPSHQVYDFVGRKEAVFNNLLSLDFGKNNGILNVYNNVKDRLVNGIYPFAEDPFGNLICFDYRNNDDIPKVVFWDHELSHENPENLGKAITPICNTFSELLAGLRLE